MELVLIASLVVAVLSSPSCRLFGADEEIFQLVGKSVSDGGRLYSEVFDHKGPFFLWLHVVGWRMAGVWGYWIVFSSLWTVAAIMFYLGVLRRGVPVWPATSCTLAATLYPIVQGYPESLASALVLIVIGCLFLAESGKHSFYAALFAGLCGAMVFYSKQTCCGFFLGLGLFYLFTRRFRDLTCYVAGGILGLVIGVAWMCLSGTFGGYVEYNWQFNANYAIPFGLWMFRRTFCLLNVYGAEMAFCAAVALVVAWRWRGKGKIWPYVVAIGVWLACDWFFVIRGWGIGEHQVRALVFSFICLLPFMWMKGEDRPGRAENVWVWMFYVGIVVSPLIMNVHTARHLREIDAPRRALVEKLKSLPAAPLVVWENQCRFQLETERPCLLAPYVQVVPLVVRNGIPEKIGKELKEKLRTVPFVLVEGQKPGSDWMRGVPRYPNDNITDEFYKVLAAVRDSCMTELPSPDPDYRLYISKELVSEK